MGRCQSAPLAVQGALAVLSKLTASAASVKRIMANRNETQTVEQKPVAAHG